MAGRVESTRYPGVYRVHRRSCDQSSCRCPSAYQATVYSVREHKRLRKHFDTLGAARTWREDQAETSGVGASLAPIPSGVSVVDLVGMHLEEGRPVASHGSETRPGARLDRPRRVQATSGPRDRSERAEDCGEA